MATVPDHVIAGNAGFRDLLEPFLQQPGLPFADVLDAEAVEQAFRQRDALFATDAVFSTPVVLWNNRDGFLFILPSFMFFRFSLPWSADGQRAEAPADRTLQFTQEAVAAQWAAAIRPSPETSKHPLILRPEQRRRPVAPPQQLAPPAQVQQAAAVGLADVGGGAAPRVSPRPPHKLGPHRVAFDVRHRLPEVHLVQDAGEEPPLPQVAAASVEPVDVLRVAQVRSPDGLGQGLVPVRDGHQVQVVGHQAVGDQLQAEPPGVLAQPPQIDPPIVIDEEDVLAVVAALRHACQAEASGEG